jgi:chemotaxis family two-component system sensor histidine kinase/response regulator PixL
MDEQGKSPKSTATEKGQAKFILVVEDSELLHQMSELLLLRYRQQGCQVLHAYNGKEAIAKLAEHPDCTLILLDLVMPEMDGLEFLEYRRQKGFHSEIPAVIMSMKGSKEEIDKGLRAGAAAYLTKPINSKEFFKLVDTLLAKKSSPARSPSLFEDEER